MKQTLFLAEYGFMIAEDEGFLFSAQLVVVKILNLEASNSKKHFTPKQQHLLGQSILEVNKQLN